VAGVSEFEASLSFTVSSRTVLATGFNLQHHHHPHLIIIIIIIIIIIKENNLES
jgi:hypothetical protein